MRQTWLPLSKSVCRDDEFDARLGRYSIGLVDTPGLRLVAMFIARVFLAVRTVREFQIIAVAC